MLRLPTITVIAALGCETASAQQSDTSSANYVMLGCRQVGADRLGQPEYLRRGLCIGIIKGIEYADPTICRPRGVTTGQLVRVVVQYIDQQPARHHEDFMALATEALRSTWPCKR